ncbi:GntR family transcriptional regulator [Acidaminobacter sp. JC074]|uniref:GntR family transcriptional regulator n=1 Tax=Acidaminobacter sp. JC074 TaxID=2530199 RepID=UPI001F0D01F7|nr:GntR family transcriptional regulator [Acidaminobacter sp. JC074]MCH4886410.1 GntR family transcriptional regulator [Acidaminobacter sp. JC074]
MQQYLSLKDHVYNYISDKIREGSLKADEKINEKIIMEDLNISRTPVREALIQLATEGYLENIPRKGFIVKPVDTEKSKEIYALLGALDAFAAELAFDFITEEDTRRMEALSKQMVVAIDTYDFKAYYKLQTDFHDVYIHKCQNEELINTMSLLRKKFIRQTYNDEDVEKMKDILYHTNKEHIEIARLFKEASYEKVSKFLKYTHWNVSYAAYDSV